MFCEVFSPGPCSLPARKLARFARSGRFAAAAAASGPQAIHVRTLLSSMFVASRSRTLVP